MDGIEKYEQIQWQWITEHIAALHVCKDWHWHWPRCALRQNRQGLKPSQALLCIRKHKQQGWKGTDLVPFTCLLFSHCCRVERTLHGELSIPPFQKAARSSLVHSSFVHSKMFHIGAFASDPCTCEQKLTVVGRRLPKRSSTQQKTLPRAFAMFSPQITLAAMFYVPFFVHMKRAGEVKSASLGSSLWPSFMPLSQAEWLTLETRLALLTRLHTDHRRCSQQSADKLLMNNNASSVHSRGDLDFQITETDSATQVALIFGFIFY